MAITLPDGFEARPATDADIDGVVAMIDADDRSLGLPTDPIRDNLIWLWHLSTMDLGRDTRVVMQGDTVVAYGEATWLTPEEGGPVQLFIRVHPESQGKGIGTWLVAWGEAVGHHRGSKGIRAVVVDRDVPGHDLLLGRGYVPVRSFFTMCKDLEPDEGPGSIPEAVTIRTYGEADERILYELNQSSFADHWEFRSTSFENFNEELHGEDWDPSLVFLADADGRAVGHVVAFTVETGGYVAYLGVLKDWRGRGIAKALLRRAFVGLASRGKREVRLGVDAQSTHGAVALYESVGMTACRRYDSLDLGTAEAASVIDRPVSGMKML